MMSIGGNPLLTDPLQTAEMKRTKNESY